ncbi:MAG: hypothetical protein RLZZ171_2031 [Cyanobacteriota bacterium]
MNISPLSTTSQQEDSVKTTAFQLLKSDLTTTCRFCQFYKFERGQGRSRGNCCKLGVSVCGHWRSCRLALPPFAPSWEKANEEIFS